MDESDGGFVPATSGQTTTIKDLHILPKVRDSWSHLYVEHAKIDQDAQAIAIHMADGTVPVPCASLSVLMLGPGTSITHAAIRTLANNGCLVQWCGEQSVRFYALGLGETRSSRNLLWQAKAWADPAMRLAVVVQMYQHRFAEKLPPGLTLRQIRGKEGIRVREAYARASRETGVVWRGRSYSASEWKDADPINQALSCANSCLYGICHAAIVAAGYSPALGFIHTGKMLSFVYDVADLYKAEITIPVAFQAVATGTKNLESRVRQTCRDMFHAENLLQQIVPDIDEILMVKNAPAGDDLEGMDEEAAIPGGLWDPGGVIAGGINHAIEPLDNALPSQFNTSDGLD